MKNLSSIFTKISLLMILLIGTQCATSQKMENTRPIKIENPYFEKWNSTAGENGFTIYIPVVVDSLLKLDYAYFKGKKIALVLDTNAAMYRGQYTYPKRNKDLVMSSDPKKEFKNTVPGIERIPFRLKDNECVIVYTKDKKEGFFKIEELSEKKL